MTDNSDGAGKTSNEMFYFDEDGKKQDAALHAEILGDDTMPWDLDLDKLGKMNPVEQKAYLRALDDAMIGK